jgi:hypothetical protein
MADEQRVKVPFPLPNSPLRDAHDVQVRESTERWTEATLEDGTVIRLKATLMKALRIENEYDPAGNPAYSLMVVPQIVIASTPDHLKKPTKPSPIQ